MEPYLKSIQNTELKVPSNTMCAGGTHALQARIFQSFAEVSRRGRGRIRSQRTTRWNLRKSHWGRSVSAKDTPTRIVLAHNKDGCSGNDAEVPEMLEILEHTTTSTLSPHFKYHSLNGG